MDYSFLPNLKPEDRSSAIRLQFEPASSNSVGWDYQARYSTTAQYASLSDTFIVTLKSGVTYDIFSSSYFDPFILLLYNNSGSVIAADSDGGSYGSDMIFHFIPTVTADYYVSASWDQGLAESHRYSSVSVYENSVPSQASTVAPAAPVTKYGTPGIDTFRLANNFDNYTVTSSPDKLVLNKKATGEIQTYYNVERLSFADKTIAYDVSGNAGQVYRLYKAAFDRVPDKDGLGFWISKMDKGNTLLDIAGKFIDSVEFQSLNGSSLTSLEFATSMYRHVLGRSPEQGGLTWWADKLDSGQISRADALAGFSESSENQIAIQGVIQGGIEYTTYA